MKILNYAKDGGEKSNVSGFYFIEIKSLFSIALLCFEKGSREAYHNHAFNACTWFLSGDIDEHHLNGKTINWKPSLRPKFTSRDCFHKVYANKKTYALSFRGPWSRTWKDYDTNTDEFITYGWGRKILDKTKVNSLFKFYEDSL